LEARRKLTEDQKERVKSECILLVDDDESSYQSLALILRKKGYDIETAMTGQEAIDQIRKKSFNVALLDIKLPDMEGTKLLASLKKISPEMDAIMVTGHASVENAVLALNEGASGYVTKPLNMDELLSRLSDLCEKQHLIKEKRRAEDSLKASLSEKDVLLKEIHHRVKNNMQIIYGLLNLQSGKILDAEVLEMIKETQYRIKSMALVHERLYQSKNLAGIEFDGYIQKLVFGLFHSYGVNPESIKSVIDAKNVFLDINTAIPCGLIINELVSNSLKHAFSNAGGKCGQSKACGQIRIKMSSDKGKNYTLIVSDNGKGFPKEIDFENTNSLGLQIVNTLVEQLEGNIELNRRNGTSFRIGFTP